MTDGASGETRPVRGKASGRDRRSGWKSPRLLVTVVVLGLLAMAAGFALAARDDVEKPNTTSPVATPTAAASPAPPEVGEVVSFSGVGNQVTKPFTVGPNWELRWQAENSEAFAVELFDIKMVSRGKIAEAPKANTGTTFVSDEGMFQLGVTATGPWSIRVVSQRVTSRPSASPSTR